MTDFSYVSKMNCRIIFKNPQTINSFFSIKVKAFGGTKSASNLYGNKYMGEWDFTNIFKTTSTGSGTVYTQSYSRETRLPSHSPWRNNTVHYVFSRNQVIGNKRMSIAEVLLYDSGSSFNDK